MSVHVGQQVIVDATGGVVAYELLFRAERELGDARVSDGDAATAQVLVATFLDFGLHELVGDHLAFVNLPRAFLVGELPLPFPAGRVVLEVLEDVPADPEVVAGVTALRSAGHLIALDDVTAAAPREELLHLAHFVKIDLLATPPDELPELVRRCSGDGRRVLAEKVETAEQFALCRSLGVDLFQGHLLGRARTVTRSSLSAGQLACLRLVSLLARPGIGTDQVVQAVEADPALTVKVLQAAGSAAAAAVRPPTSVREAVLRVGRTTLQAWATLLSRGAGGSPVPVETALRRARMCQLLAEGRGLDGPAAFLVGLLHGLAVALGAPLEELLESLALAAPLAAALLDGQGPLAEVLAAALAYEAGSLELGQLASAAEARAAYVAALAFTARSRQAVPVRDAA